MALVVRFTNGETKEEFGTSELRKIGLRVTGRGKKTWLVESKGGVGAYTFEARPHGIVTGRRGDTIGLHISAANKDTGESVIIDVSEIAFDL